MARYTHGRRYEDFTYVSSCVKYMVFSFNLLFWIVGGAMIGIGAWSFLEEYNEAGLPSIKSALDIVFHISIVLMVVGGFIFTISFAGCLGALRENLCLLKFYSLTMLLLFLGELVLATVALIFPNKLSEGLNSLSKEPIVKYREDTNLQNLIDFLQLEFQCCGISDGGYRDWSQNMYFNCSVLNNSTERCGVPYSCCKDPHDIEGGLINIMCGYNVQNSSSLEVIKRVHTRGCINGIKEFVNQNLYLVAGICFGAALIQLFAMYMARTLLGQIEAQRARWT